MAGPEEVQLTVQTAAVSHTRKGDLKADVASFFGDTQSTAQATKGARRNSGVFGSFQALGLLSMRIQRMWRLREGMYKNYGCEMFVDSKGNNSPHGRLLFQGGC